MSMFIIILKLFSCHLSSLRCLLKSIKEVYIYYFIYLLFAYFSSCFCPTHPFQKHFLALWWKTFYLTDYVLLTSCVYTMSKYKKIFIIILIIHLPQLLEDSWTSGSRQFESWSFQSKNKKKRGVIKWNEIFNLPVICHDRLLLIRLC